MNLLAELEADPADTVLCQSLDQIPAHFAAAIIAVGGPEMVKTVHRPYQWLGCDTYDR